MFQQQGVLSDAIIAMAAMAIISARFSGVFLPVIRSTHQSNPKAMICAVCPNNLVEKLSGYQNKTYIVTHYFN